MNSIGPFDFFEVLPDGNTLLYDTTKCERCGKECLAPNAVGGVGADVIKYTELGMIERKSPFSELWWSDELGEAVCMECLDWASRSPKDARKVLFGFIGKHGVDGLIRILGDLKAENARDPVLEWICERIESSAT